MAESPTLILHKGSTYEPDVLLNLVVAAANGAVAIQNSTVIITKGTACALTLGTPSTAQNGTRVRFVSTTAAAHTVTNATVGFNNGGAGGDVGTFGAAIANGFEVVAYGGVWWSTWVVNVTFA